MLEFIFVAYGFLAISHLCLQMWLASEDYWDQKFRRKGYSLKRNVAVIIPVYNEDPSLLRRCIQSVVDASYYAKVVVVDDGSKNRLELDEVYAHFAREYENIRIIKKGNEGKRRAQYEALNSLQNEEIDIVVTIDSDTVLQKKAISRILEDFDEDSIGAVTGNILALNKEENFLTQLIHYRYWMAFNQERAAQSRFNVLMCCSGPFSAYRMSILQKVRYRYISQRFLGKECTYGDDRHLTNLVLEEGWKVRYNQDALALTIVPNTVKGYIRQQTRWNKSFYREMLWTLKSIRKHHWYLLYDLSMQLLLPILLIFALAHVVLASYENPMRAIVYLAIVVAISLGRISYGIVMTRDIGFLRFLAYSLLHVFILIPTRLYAVATIADRRWGTR